jgi:hypothetical protein
LRFCHFFQFAGAMESYVRPGGVERPPPGTAEETVGGSGGGK